MKIDVEVGGATSEAQQQYLNTVLASKDSALDLMLIDVIRPAQWAAQGWAEPLDSYLGADKAKILPTYLKAYAEANQVNGKLIALPYFADSQFLYYRKDLLEKYKRPVPKTWDDMMETAKLIMDGEKNPQLQGFSTAGAPIEGTVCTYLVPLWGCGQRSHQGRQAQPRHAGGAAAVPALRPDEAGGRAAQEHRRDSDRPHPRRLPGAATSCSRRPGATSGTASRTTPTRRSKGKVGVTVLPARQGRQERDLHRRLAARGERVLEEQGRGGEVRALPVVAGSVEACRRSWRRTCRCSRRCTGIRRC